MEVKTKVIPHQLQHDYMVKSLVNSPFHLKFYNSISMYSVCYGFLRKLQDNYLILSFTIYVPYLLFWTLLLKWYRIMKIYTLYELSDNLNYWWIDKSLVKYHVQKMYWPKPFETFHQFLFCYRSKLQTSFYEYNL